jgi:GTP 3',8-cyclase
VTDRCDFRCVYCMSEHMSLEELARLGEALIARGVTRLRLTGGEPLVRRDVMTLIRALGQHIGPQGLEELTLTTNGSQLARFAGPLVEAGVRRINVSLDTLDAERFRAITRWGNLDQVLAGISAARAAGLGIKINMVALKGVNDQSMDEMLRWCGDQGFDLTLIETMPLGEIETDRADQYLSLAEVRADLARRWTLVDSAHRTGGPARYVHVAETGGRLGFITPLSHNFCESCNRVRITCTGELFMCLGQEDKVDLRTALRASDDGAALDAALDLAMRNKPKGHDFVIERQRNTPAVRRHMSVTGG